MKQILQPFAFVIRSDFWISMFVVAYCFLAMIWLLRDSNTGLGRLNQILSPITLTIGIDQNWSLFSPQIRNFNFHNIALITFRNGAIKLYEWPRMDRPDFYSQRRDEKYRKFFIDCLPWPECKDVLPSTARFVARANANPANPPIKVSLGYFWSFIPPPKRWTSQSELPYKTRYTCYFTYRVHPEDLK